MVSLEENVMFVIGIDPHEGSHTAPVLDDSEHLAWDRCAIRSLSLGVSKLLVSGVGAGEGT